MIDALIGSIRILTDRGINAFGYSSSFLEGRSPSRNCSYEPLPFVEAAAPANSRQTEIARHRPMIRCVRVTDGWLQRRQALRKHVVEGGVREATLPTGWQLVAVGDFNRDGRPDLVVYNASTHVTAIYFTNNNVLTSSVSGPTLPAGWSSVSVADFNQDGEVDYPLFNPVTRQRLNLSSSKPFNGISNLEALRPLAGSFKKSRTAGSL
jgi:hypothetical protein